MTEFVPINLVGIWVSLEGQGRKMVCDMSVKVKQLRHPFKIVPCALRRWVMCAKIDGPLKWTFVKGIYPCIYSFVRYGIGLFSLFHRSSASLSRTA